MKLGELRDVVEIQKCNEVVVGGYSEKEYITIYSLRAKKKTVSTKEYINFNSNSIKLTLKFIVRKIPIDSEHYVLYKNERYNIKHIHEFEDREFIELTVERID